MMRRYRERSLIGLAPGLFLSAFGCKSDAPVEKPVTLVVIPAGSALPIDHPEVVTAGNALRPRRLSAAQWDKVYPALLGNDVKGAPIMWSGASSAQQRSALGEPDFLATTEEALEPNVVYAKYNSDSAYRGCDLAVRADLARTTGRIIVRFASLTDTVESNPSAIDANLVFMKEHFHAVRAKADDAARIAPLRVAFQKAVQTSTEKTQTLKVLDGWKLVCVALITSPEFNAY
jgi:hypothetical protein